MHDYIKLISSAMGPLAFGPIFLYFKIRIENGNVARRRCKIVMSIAKGSVGTIVGETNPLAFKFIINKEVGRGT
ncbi:MAG: hypothetical protein WAW52_15765, partial [Methanothrix sp.]